MGDYGFFELAAWVRSVLYQEMGTAAQVAAAANLVISQSFEEGHSLRVAVALLHKSAIGQGIPNPK